MAEEPRAHNGDEERNDATTPEDTSPETPTAEEAQTGAGETVDVPDQAAGDAAAAEEAAQAAEDAPSGADLASVEAGDDTPEGVSLDMTPEEEPKPEAEASADDKSLMEELAAQRAAAKAQADAEREAAQRFVTQDTISEEEAAEEAAAAAAAAAFRDSSTKPSETQEAKEAAEEGLLLEVPDEVMDRAEKAKERRAKKAEKEAAEAEEGDEEDEERPSEPLIRPVPDDGIRRRWYAIHAHSGQEGSVKRMLEAKAEQEGLSDKMTNVFVPMEEVAEIRSGEKKVSKRKFFPGYVLVQLPEHPERHADLWHLIRETTGVTGFIGSRTVPVPLEDDEVNAIIEEIRGERERPKPKVSFEKEERVKIIDGPFANFVGTIDEINQERGTLKVLVEIFERLTSVEVEFWQVEHI